MAKLLTKLLSVSPPSHLLKLEPCTLSSVRFLRGILPEQAKTLKQKLDEIEKCKVDPSIHFKVNIGLPYMKPSRSEEYQKRIQLLRELKKMPEHLKHVDVPLEKIHQEWLKTSGPFHIKSVAEHYNIFNDLFGEAYFVPRIQMKIRYQEEDGTKIPVYYGNQIKPSEAKTSPTVSFDADPSTLWSLVLTNPDSHFTESAAEYVHWFIGNIPGGDITKGETVIDYMQPFPAKGTGYQRMIFILYKQEKVVDFSAFKKEAPCRLLMDRTFRTKDFYRLLQDDITPAGLAFFQTNWESSLTEFFHQILDMKEPIFEYEFPVPYQKPPVWFPKRQPFNLYMDRYRDQKQIAKELLVKRLKSVDPFKAPEKEFKYPNALPEDTNLPSWYRVELRKQRLKFGRYSES